MAPHITIFDFPGTTLVLPILNERIRFEPREGALYLAIYFLP